MEIMTFPEIPVDLRTRGTSRIEVATGVDEWVQETFFNPNSPFYNFEHEPLIEEEAKIGYLWTHVENAKHGKGIIGTAQLGEPAGGTPWAKIRQYEQLERWFGIIPDFVITLDSCFLFHAEPVGICALIEHELYHCAQKRNQYGEPSFNHEGEPVWTMRPHDVEEFIGVAKRYGAWGKDLRDMRDALMAEPIFGRVQLEGICGVCARA